MVVVRCNSDTDFRWGDYGEFYICIVYSFSSVSSVQASVCPSTSILPKHAHLHGTARLIILYQYGSCSSLLTQVTCSRSWQTDRLWNCIMTNVMQKFLIYLSIYFCRTCFGLSLSPSSEAGGQIRQWFKSPGYGVSARVLTPYPGDLKLYTCLWRWDERKPETCKAEVNR
jgi:hypothetical protein